MTKSEFKKLKPGDKVVVMRVEGIVTKVHDDGFVSVDHGGIDAHYYHNIVVLK